MEINQAAPQISGCVKRAYAYSRAFIKCHYGKNLWLPPLKKCPYRKEKE